MTRSPTRRRLLGVVAAAAGGLAGCLGSRGTTPGGASDGTTGTTTNPDRDTTGDSGGATTTDQGTTETTDGETTAGGNDPATFQPTRRGDRPAVVDLALSTSLDAVVGADPDPVSAFETVAAEFGRVVVDGEDYAVRFGSLDADTAVCQVVPTRNVAVVARPTTPPAGASVRAVSELPDGARPAVERAIAEGSYRWSKMDQEVGTVGGTGGTTTDPPAPGNLPPLSWIRADRPYVVGSFRWQSPSCTVGVHEYTLTPAGDATGPAVGAVDATGAESREAVAGATGGAYEGSGDPPAALRSVAAFDYAATVDARRATYHRPSLSVEDGGYTFRLKPVLSGTVGP